jgi:hypothetical protein
VVEDLTLKKKTIEKWLFLVLSKRTIMSIRSNYCDSKHIKKRQPAEKNFPRNSQLLFATRVICTMLSLALVLSFFLYQLN